MSKWEEFPAGKFDGKGWTLNKGHVAPAADGRKLHALVVHFDKHRTDVQARVSMVLSRKTISGSDVLADPQHVFWGWAGLPGTYSFDNLEASGVTFDDFSVNFCLRKFSSKDVSDTDIIFALKVEAVFSA